MNHPMISRKYIGSSQSKYLNEEKRFGNSPRFILSLSKKNENLVSCSRLQKLGYKVVSKIRGRREERKEKKGRKKIGSGFEKLLYTSGGD